MKKLIAALALSLLPLSSYSEGIADKITKIEIKCEDLNPIRDRAISQIWLQFEAIKKSPEMEVGEAVIRVAFIQALEDVIISTNRFEKENCLKG